MIALMMLRSSNETLAINVLLCEKVYFIGNYNSRRIHRIHTPLHPGPEWRIFRMSRSRVQYID